MKQPHPNSLKNLAAHAFRPGQSGNAKGRTPGIARLVREKTRDGAALIEYLAEVVEDVARPDKDRLRATELLMDRGYGKAATLNATLELNERDRPDLGISPDDLTRLAQELGKQHGGRFSGALEALSSHLDPESSEAESEAANG